MKGERMLHLKTYADAAGFPADVGAYLAEDEAVNGLMLGLAGQLVNRPSMCKKTGRPK
jgi:hypothetical protein